MGSPLRRPDSRARSAVFSPLAEQGRASQIAQRLTDAIWSGLLSDRERLPSEADLAEMFGVATVTVREALTGMRAQGLVETTRGRGGGSFVRRPTAGNRGMLMERLAAMSRVDLQDRAVQYQLVRSGCAELAAQRADDIEVDLLRALIPGPDVQDVAVWRHADAETHLSLAALTRSARVTRDVVRLENEFGGILRLPYDQPEVRLAVRQSQLEVVAAVADGRPRDASKISREQIQVCVRALTELLV